MICARCKEVVFSTTHTAKEDERIQPEYRGVGLCNECYIDISPDAEVSHACVECGTRTRKGNWYAEVEEELKFFGLCFTCNHAVGLLCDDSDKNVIVSDGKRVTHYQIEEEPSAGSSKTFLGFGGSEMVIEFFDGRKQVSHNLWCQGGMPPHFNDRFIPNATVNGFGSKEVAA